MERGTGSLPVWEEWIEMSFMRRVRAVRGLFPYGKSGLKCRARCGGRVISLSLPVWEEWIEIYREGAQVLSTVSLPVWEEWIEMEVCPPDKSWEVSLFPYGKSGLKSCGPRC